MSCLRGVIYGCSTSQGEPRGPLHASQKQVSTPMRGPVFGKVFTLPYLTPLQVCPSRTDCCLLPRFLNRALSGMHSLRIFGIAVLLFISEHHLAGADNVSTPISFFNSVGWSVQPLESLSMLIFHISGLTYWPLP